MSTEIKPAEVKPQTPAVRQQHFLISGDVEYLEPGDKKVTQVMKVDGVFASPMPKFNAHALSDIQVMLQRRFFTKFAKTHPFLPEVTDVTIYAISPIGEFTQEEFMAGM